MAELKLQCLCLAHRKHPDQAHLRMFAGKEEMNTSSPESGWNQEIVSIYQHFFTLFYHRNSPCTVCSIKETSTQTQARQFLGTLVCQLLCLLAFQIESLFLASAPDVSHGESYELGLSNKIVPPYLSYDPT